MAEAPDELLGGCLCGDVRYRLRGDPLALYACHCTDCQRQTGSAFGLSLIVPRDRVELVQGAPSRFEVALADGRTKRGVFCPRCAARLWGEPARWGAIRVVRPGTLDAPGRWTPWGDIWTDEAQAWVRLTGGPTFPRQPEDAGALVKAWQTHHAR